MPARVNDTQKKFHGEKVHNLFSIWFAIKRKEILPQSRAAKSVKKTFTHRTPISVNSIFHYAQFFFLSAVCFLQLKNILYALLIIPLNGATKKKIYIGRCTAMQITFYLSPYGCVCLHINRIAFIYHGRFC